MHLIHGVAKIFLLMVVARWLADFSLFPIVLLNDRLKHEFQLTPDFRSSGMLGDVVWQLVTDVSVQPIDPIFNGQTKSNSSWTVH
jgi:hypothetical protein